MFDDKENQVALLKRLLPDERDITPEDIKNVTLKNIVLSAVYNDLGLLFRDKLVVLMEAQSTWTFNILPRLLEYVAKTFSEYMVETNQDWYSTTKVSLPRVELFVVYVGEQSATEKPSTISLTESFYDGIACSLDVRVKVISKESGNDILSQYIRFSRITYEVFAVFGKTEEAVWEIIRRCKEEGILVDYLRGREKEVLSIMLELFDKEEAYRRSVLARENRAELKGRIEMLADMVYSGDIPLARGREKAMLEAKYSAAQFDELLRSRHSDFVLSS